MGYIYVNWILAYDQRGNMNLSVGDEIAPNIDREIADILIICAHEP